MLQCCTGNLFNNYESNLLTVSVRSEYNNSKQCSTNYLHSRTTETQIYQLTLVWPDGMAQHVKRHLENRVQINALIHEKTPYACTTVKQTEANTMNNMDLISHQL